MPRATWWPEIKNGTSMPIFVASSMRRLWGIFRFSFLFKKSMIAAASLAPPPRPDIGGMCFSRRIWYENLRLLSCSRIWIAFRTELSSAGRESHSKDGVADFLMWIKSWSCFVRTRIVSISW